MLMIMYGFKKVFLKVFSIRSLNTCEFVTLCFQQGWTNVSIILFNRQIYHFAPKELVGNVM